MAGPKIRKKLKKKPVKKILGGREVNSVFSKFSNSALQGFAKLIKQGYSTAEAIKKMKDKE